MPIRPPAAKTPSPLGQGKLPGRSNGPVLRGAYIIRPIGWHSGTVFVHNIKAKFIEHLKEL